MIPELVCFRNVTDEPFVQLVSQLKLWGVPVLVYHRRDNMRHLDTRGQTGFYMGPGSEPSMDRVFLGAGGSRAVKQFRHSSLFTLSRARKELSGGGGVYTVEHLGCRGIPSNMISVNHNAMYVGGTALLNAADTECRSCVQHRTLE